MWLKDKTVLITGAAHGLGKALAQNAAEQQAKLILLDIDERGLEETSKELTASFDQTHHYVVDISDQAKLIEVFQEIEKMSGAIDLLINNAAVSHTGRIEKTRQADFEWVIKINLVGTANVCQLAIPLIRKSSLKMIANVASGIAFHGIPKFSAYGASKAGLRSFSQSLRAELQPEGFMVSCIFPGPINSNISERARHVSLVNKEREKSYLATKGYPPDQLAKKIFKDLKKGKKEILLGKEVWWAKHIIRLFPGMAERYLIKYQEKLPV